jgi:hypothetical protein
VGASGDATSLISPLPKIHTNFLQLFSKHTSLIQLPIYLNTTAGPIKPTEAYILIWDPIPHPVNTGTLFVGYFSRAKHSNKNTKHTKHFHYM